MKGRIRYMLMIIFCGNLFMECFINKTILSYLYYYMKRCERKSLQTLDFAGFFIRAYLSKQSIAEREGFEPSVQLPIQRFSRPSHSTALAPLRKDSKCN